MASLQIPDTVPDSPDCAACPVRWQAVCACCDPAELARLDRMKSYRSYAKAESIAYAGARMTHLGTLVSGVAVLSQGMADGRRQIMGLLLPGDFIGRPQRQYFQFDIIAAQKVKICRFERAEFEKLMRGSAALSGRLLDMAFDELDAAREWMLVLGRKSARERLASLIDRLGQRQTRLPGELPPASLSFELPLTRDMLADYLGLTKETVSRQMTALRRAGIIKQEGRRRLIVPDRDRLLDQTGSSPPSGNGIWDTACQPENRDQQQFLEKKCSF